MSRKPQESGDRPPAIVKVGGGLSACLRGHIAETILADKYEDARGLAQTYLDIFGRRGDARSRNPTDGRCKIAVHLVRLRAQLRTIVSGSFVVCSLMRRKRWPSDETSYW